MRSLKTYYKAAIGFLIMCFYIRKFDPTKVFSGKSVAIIGPADSLMDEQKGEYIDSFDLVVRINKALVNWKPEDEVFTGKRTDILVHSFYENTYSGGGKLDIGLFKQKNLKYLVNAMSDLKGYRLTFNFYKKYLLRFKVYQLANKVSKSIRNSLKGYVPTNGYYAICMVISGKPKKIYISGFTFFKSPYRHGYRDELLDLIDNEKHIESQGLHDPELEYNEFKKLYNDNFNIIELDERLFRIINSN